MYTVTILSSCEITCMIRRFVLFSGGKIKSAESADVLPSWPDVYRGKNPWWLRELNAQQKKTHEKRKNTSKLRKHLPTV